MDASLKQRLSEVVGARGVSAQGVVMPATVEAVAAVARVLGETQTPFSVSSGAESAGAAADGVLVLSVHRLNLVTLAAPSLTLHAQAGATVDQVRHAVEAQRLAVVGLGTQVDAHHVGSVIARGELSRRALCGIEAVLPTGDVVHVGGVLKDVVGYDLSGVLLGSMGRLAIIVAATFRLEPATAKTPSPPAPGATRGESIVARAFDPHSLLRARG